LGKLRRHGIKASELHGKLDQSDRDSRLGAFRSGKIRVLVATDLAARGIDVRGLSAVINYDLPRGRTITCTGRGVPDAQAGRGARYRS
jgi:superfamily II DNA/RNA helicase